MSSKNYNVEDIPDDADDAGQVKETAVEERVQDHERFVAEVVVDWVGDRLVLDCCLTGTLIRSSGLILSDDHGGDV